MDRVVTMDISGMDEDIYKAYYALADPYRQEKADRYLRKQDRYRCIAADALLRYGMEELGIRGWRIARNEYGKPYLEGQKEICFNISHAGRYVAIAYGEGELGVDVEQYRRDGSLDGIARRFFSEDEQAYLYQREEGRTERFFRIWTAKESYLKYLGTGLHTPLQSFSVLTLKGPRFYQASLKDSHCLTICSQNGPPEFRSLDADGTVDIRDLPTWHLLGDDM